MAEKKKISTKIKNYQEKEKKNRKELLDIIEKEINLSKQPKEIVIEKADFIETKSDKESATKMVAEKVWGVKQQKADKTIDKRQKVFKNLFTIIFIVFVVCVLLFTAYNDFFSPDENRNVPEWKDFKLLLVHSWQYLIYALLCLFGGLLIKGLKLAIMCKKMTGSFHYKTCFETGIIGSYYNNVTPLAVGGQPFEIYHLSKHGIHGGVASSLPIAAYITNQFAFVILGLIAVALYSTNALGIPSVLTGAFPLTFTVMATVGIICCSIMPILVILFCFMPRTCSKVVHFAIYLGSKMRIVKDPKKTTIKTIKNIIHNATCLKKLASQPFILIGSFFLSFVEHISNASIAYFSLKAFNFHIDGMGGGMEFLQILQLCFIVFLAVSFIPTPGNAGAADLSFYALFKIGLPQGFAFPAMAVWRGLSFYSYIVIGFVFANLKKRSDKKKQLLNPQPQESETQAQNDPVDDIELPENIMEIIENDPPDSNENQSADENAQADIVAPQPQTADSENQ